MKQNSSKIQSYAQQSFAFRTLVCEIKKSLSIYSHYSVRSLSVRRRTFEIVSDDNVFSPLVFDLLHDFSVDYGVCLYGYNEVVIMCHV